MSVRVDGLREFRRDLKKMDPELVKELRRALKEAAEAVLPTAKHRAPQRSGKLEGSLKAGTSGDKAYIGSSLRYAGVQHFGGTISPKGTPIHIKPTLYVSSALEDEAGTVMDKVEDGLTRVAQKTGWNNAQS